MPRPTKAQQLARAARQAQPVQRIQIPRVACLRCRQGGILALPDGVTPRPHLRPAIPSDPTYREDIPIKVECS